LAYRNAAPTEGGVRLMRIDVPIACDAGRNARRAEGDADVAA
jgi:hypothetical protein